MPPCRFTIRPGTRRIGPNRSLQPSFAVSCATSRVCNVSLPARRLSSRLAVLPPGVQGGQGHTRLHQHSSSKPTAHSGFAPAISISRSRLLFSFLQWLRRGDPALGPHPHRTERRRDKVARIGWSRPRRARASIVLRRPHRGGHLQSPQAALAPEFPRRAVEHPPQSLGAFLLAKAAYTRLGPEKAGVRASRPRSSTRKARMAFLTLCEAHPRSWAIFGGEFPRGLARRIWHRRITKASPARSPASRLSRSFSDLSVSSASPALSRGRHCARARRVLRPSD